MEEDVIEDSLKDHEAAFLFRGLGFGIEDVGRATNSLQKIQAKIDLFSLGICM